MRSFQLPYLFILSIIPIYCTTTSPTLATSPTNASSTRLRDTTQLHDLLTKVAKPSQLVEPLQRTTPGIEPNVVTRANPHMPRNIVLYVLSKQYDLRTARVAPSSKGLGYIYESLAPHTTRFDSLLSAHKRPLSCAITIHQPTPTVSVLHETHPHRATTNGKEHSVAKVKTHLPNGISAKRYTLKENIIEPIQPIDQQTQALARETKEQTGK
ncbi:hypothetical protein BYT27DRAFT_7261456 [Phlegmacium glaucopus]|nr:hypothetical protein BYT27DRAFT_7261456 [Phlegmacium glaucopus]